MYRACKLAAELLELLLVLQRAAVLERAESVRRQHLIRIARSAA